ncbi:MAG TPA: BlaI/MecI/CopY family transcriptional regulator [Nitrososphaerales archaeon]|nr:BlaI/MecI/CopY family transcriptional regulator [Nitrososphaerales archaeon]HUK75870.1 BlaI/MecI/CopY family transcriptional regulator [Nitrososphaerales archaeon]
MNPARDPDIGDLEADVLSAMKRMGSSSAGEITDEMKNSRPIAYTTVSTTLDRLCRKGLLERKEAVGKTGRKYVYSLPSSRLTERKVVNKMVDKLVSAFGPSVASAIYDRLNELTPEEARKLGQAVETQRKRPGGAT